MGAPKSKTWVWQFDRPAGEVWPVMSDTACFNEAANLPKQTKICSPVARLKT